MTIKTIASCDTVGCTEELEIDLKYWVHGALITAGWLHFNDGSSQYCPEHKEAVIKEIGALK